MKGEHILIRRDDEDYHLHLYIDSYECYTLSHVYDIGMKIKQLSQSGDKYIIRSEEQLRVSSPTIYTIAKVLDILEETTCGCCNSPWLNSDTFESLVKAFRYYEG